MAMKIAGHHREFECYNFKTADDVQAALLNAGQYGAANVAQIADRMATR